MASKTEPFITKTVKKRAGARKIKKLVSQGWEVVGETGRLFNQSAVLRRPNPKYRGQQ